MKINLKGTFKNYSLSTDENRNTRIHTEGDLITPKKKISLIFKKVIYQIN